MVQITLKEMWKWGLLHLQPKSSFHFRLFLSIFEDGSIWKHEGNCPWEGWCHSFPSLGRLMNSCHQLGREGQTLSGSVWLQPLRHSVADHSQWPVTIQLELVSPSNVQKQSKAPLCTVLLSDTEIKRTSVWMMMSQKQKYWCNKSGMLRFKGINTPACQQTCLQNTPQTPTHHLTKILNYLPSTWDLNRKIAVLFRSNSTGST